MGLGRKNQSEQKKVEILEAYTQCVIEHGLRDTNFETIADRLQRDRSTIYHYFKSQDELIAHWISHAISAYSDKQEAALADIGPQARPARLVEYLFTEMHWPEYSRVMDELMVLANHNSKAAKELKRLYTSFEGRLIRTLTAFYPNAPIPVVRAIGSSLAQMSEGAVTFLELGFDADRMAYARAGATVLLSALKQYEDLSAIDPTGLA